MKLPNEVIVSRMRLNKDLKIDCFDAAVTLDAGALSLGAEVVERTFGIRVAVILFETLSEAELLVGCRFDFRGRNDVRVSGIMRFFSVSISEMHTFQ
jgi:hypothetical protein